MPNNTISQVEVNGTTYDLLDMNTLSAVSALNTRVTTLESSEMSVDVRGSAKLEEHGGLVMRNGSLGIGSLVQESDGAVRGGIAGLTAEGHAEQFSTTGKNLLPNMATSQTVNGVSFTVNADGSVTANGTATADAVIFMCTQTIINATLSNGATYTISGASVAGAHVQLWSGDNKVRGNYRGTFTWNGPSERCNFAIFVDSGVTLNNVTIYPQLELGSTATEYEPYTGGAPSPSPDYPQEIQVVRGRNLLPSTATSQTINGVTFTVNADGSVTANGTANARVLFQLATNVSIQAGQYVLSDGGAYSRNVYWLELAIRTGETEEAWPRTDQANATFTVGDGKNFKGYIVVEAGATLNNVTFKPQLTLGSTPQPYVPYGYVGLEVRNTLDASALIVPSGSNTTVDADGYVTDSGDARIWTYGNRNWQIDLTAGAYALVCEVATASTSTYAGVGAFTSDNTVIFNYNGAASSGFNTVGTHSFTFTLAQDATIGIMIKAFGGHIRLSLESAIPIPLPSRGWVGSLPDGTADVLTLDGAGKVTWELKDDEVTFDGSENWSMQSPSTHKRFTTVVLADVVKRTTSTSNLPNVYASHFSQLSSSDSWGNNVSSVSIETIGLVMFVNPSITDLGSWTAWLSTHPVTVLYPLATPIIEECGYINMPSIEGDCTVSIPELDALGVKYFVDDSVGTLARQWYDREVNESDESLAQSIAMIESTTAKSNHAVNSYFMLDNVLRKATSAIASGETISNSNSSPITVEQVITTLNNSVAALEKEVVFATTPSVSHRNIYRGKNLGTTLTTAQKAQIAAGTFDDLYVGDYWTINGRVYRIADIDYYYNSGDTAFTKHHLVIVPDAIFGYNKMNDTNITTGAYMGSKMYTDSSSVLNTAKTTIANDFGSALATHRIYLQNATTNGYASAGAWTDSTVDLMNEPMVYGSYIFTPAGNGSIVVNRYTAEKSQLALFRLNHRMINPERYWYWLRDVVSGTAFAYLTGYGNAAYADASIAHAVRPFFCIVGD